MEFGSLFSGIGGFDLGFERAGLICSWQVEIDPKCQEVLLMHHSNAERFTDVREVGKHNLATVDAICGGFPCQDLSVAGKRAGLAGERSGLWFEFARIIDELEPRWVVIENVPGLLSSNRGADFAVIVQWLVKRGYGVAWRVLDAQYFGVAQRRRRVFIVASFGSGRAAEVLFEREGMSRDTPPSREAGARPAPTIAGGFAGSGGGNRYGMNVETAASLQIANAISANPANRLSGEDTYITGPLQSHSQKHGHAMTTQQAVESNQIIALPLTYGRTNDHNDESQQTYISWDKRQITSPENRSQPNSEYTPSLNVAAEMMVGVRRLTPTECARLQDFPDDWNDWLSDSTRYRQYGNAVCVPVAEWIGKKIMGLEK